MNPDANRKPEPIDPENEARLIELELLRQRAARQNAGTPYQGLRMASFIFLFVILLGALGLGAYYFLVKRDQLEELRSNLQHTSVAATATPPP